MKPSPTEMAYIVRFLHLRGRFAGDGIAHGMTFTPLMPKCGAAARRRASFE